MEWISVVGLLALLGIAWALSFHRRDVRWRIVAWGLSLQFLFALIILRQDFWSFIGMGIFGALLLAYILQPTDREKGVAWGPLALQLAVAGGLGFLLCRFLPEAVLWLLGLAVLWVLVNGRRHLAPASQAPASALIVVTGVCWFISRGVYGQAIFKVASEKVSSFLALSDFGAKFLFANLADAQYYFVSPDSPWPGFGFQFAFKVLPTIIFFGGFMAVLYHLGIMQKVIEAISHFMRWTIGTSGAETLSCSANIFVGQTEAPLLIKPFLEGMTRSELLTVMVGGFATIAGGVLAGYIAMGVPAAHLIAASVMAAPAALAIGKILYPELEQSSTAGDVKMPELGTSGNVIEAATNGISDGLKLAVNVGAMLVGFIALIAVVDVILNFTDSLIDGRLLAGEYVKYAAVGLSPATGEFAGYFPGSLQTLFGTLLRPLAFLMGVPWQDSAQVGNLLGVKLSLNEFVAYGTLSSYIQQGALSERAIVISTYALCGFANFSSIGIQIGGISALAPGRKADLARIGLKAMLGGAIASCITATIAGMLI
jgi:CNT family concentrative nucleoside transporter